VYVEADLGDGVPRFFLVDTGSSVTTLTQGIAAELGLSPVEQPGWLEGIGGRSTWLQATVPSVSIGRNRLDNVNVAVGVKGVPEWAGPIPIAGLMGNNVWSQYDIQLDYRRGYMVLAPPGEISWPQSSAPMEFNGQHVMVAADVSITDSGLDPVSRTLLFNVDTGSSGLFLSTGLDDLEEYTTLGEEAIYGVGSGDDLPATNFLQKTRRLQVDAVRIAGTTVSRDIEVVWLDGQTPPTRNLLGHAVLDDHTLTIGYQDNRISLLPGVGESSQPQLAARYGEWLARNTRGVDDAAVKQAQVWIWRGELGRAERVLERHLRVHRKDPPATIMLANLVRRRGDLTRANGLLSRLSASQLLLNDALVTQVNSLWLAGDVGAAESLARLAVDEQPEHPGGWVALSDALHAQERFDEARVALGTSNRLAQNPDGHLLRRARIASDNDDQYGAITHMRRLMEIFPHGSVTPWFYALEVGGDTGCSNARCLDENQRMLLEDLDAIRARLHPGEGPLDFLAGAYHVVDPDRTVSTQLKSQGIIRDCDPLLDESSRLNCHAWYRALVAQDLDQAQSDALAALAAHPHRAEYLDTLAIIEEALGNHHDAHRYARQAAALQPNDFYLLWQATRQKRDGETSGG